jgi:hypothetical protein
MSETDPGRSEQHAGDVGAHRATVGTPTERESINVPPTRPGAADNARQAEIAREEHETFIPETPIPDERTEAAESHTAEEESLGRGHGVDLEKEDDDVRKSIKDTRNELGDTVSALADKADVKGRAAEAADKAKGRAAEATGVAKGKAAEAAGTAKGVASEVAGTAKGVASEVAGTAKGKASEVAGKVRGATPEPVKEAATEAKKRPVLLLAAAGAVIALIVRRVRKRNRVK